MENMYRSRNYLYLQSTVYPYTYVYTCVLVCTTEKRYCLYSECKEEKDDDDGGASSSKTVHQMNHFCSEGHRLMAKRSGTIIQYINIIVLYVVLMAIILLYVTRL